MLERASSISYLCDLRLVPTSEIFPQTGKLIFLRRENIFQVLEKNFKKREKPG